MVIDPNRIIIPNGESLNENFSANESSFKITKRYLFRNCSVKIFQRLFFLSTILRTQKYTKFTILTL